MVKITVLTAAAVAAGLVAGCGSPAPGVVTPHTSATPGVVAWVGQSAAPVPFVLQSPPCSTGARSCRPADLSVSHGELGIRDREYQRGGLLYEPFRHGVLA